MNEQNENNEPWDTTLLGTEIEKKFMTMSVSAEIRGRGELRTFCLMLSAIERRGGLEALITSLNPEIAKVLGELLERENQRSSWEWPEEIEFNEE